MNNWASEQLSNWAIELMYLIGNNHCLERICHTPGGLLRLRSAGLFDYNIIIICTMLYIIWTSYMLASMCPTWFWIEFEYICLAVGIPPAKETFFQVAMRTCFGWNVSVPTIASLQIENVWSSVGENIIAERKFQSPPWGPSTTKKIPSQRRRYRKLNTNLISAFSHSLISMPSLSFLEYKSRSNLDEL